LPYRLLGVRKWVKNPKVFKVPRSTLKGKVNSKDADIEKMINAETSVLYNLEELVS
jgi:hypothetical protein